MAEIFISYARKDTRELALRLQDSLVVNGHLAWLDTSEIAGGASWSQDIERAIERCEVVLALLSEGSYSSEICRAEQLRALRKGKRVIPLLTHSKAERPLHLEHLNYRDFSDAHHYDAALQTLLGDVANGQTVLLPERHKHTYVTAPSLPINFIPRPEDMERLRRVILGDSAARHVALTALEGMGGIGKSVLAIALCQDEVIQAAFPDGVIWATIGREPGNLVSQMTEIGRALGDTREAYDTPEASANRLRTALRDKAVLLVLDDVWDARHLEPFRIDAPRCRTLFTTRDGEIALSLGAQEVKLDVFTPDQALALLREWAERDDPQLPAIAERLGYLPVALKLAGARLREGVSGADWLATFGQHPSQLKLGRRSVSAKDNLQVCFDFSVERLRPDDRELYHSLGIFPEDTPIPTTTIARLWRHLQPALSQTDCEDVVVDLARLALLERDATSKLVTLHDLLYDYTRTKLNGQVAETHSALLTAYNPRRKPWAEIPDDGYLYRHLAYHLREAGRQQELRHLLYDFPWLHRANTL